MLRTLFPLAALLLSLACPAWSKPPAGNEATLEKAGWTNEVFKTSGKSELKIWIRTPQKPATAPRPAIVFFYGGGWSSRHIAQFQEHGEVLAARGMVAFLADYRSKQTYGGSPFDCVEDAKSAIRYLRKNADRLGIDPNRLAAGGGSAGGHLAAATATVPGLNAPTDDLTLSCVPNALVLFNPVFDNGPPKGFGYGSFKDRFQEISPLHNIRKGAPPTIVFLGTKDNLIPVETAKEYEAKMKGVGSHCETHLYPDAQHGFFNTDPHRQPTIQQMLTFLESQGYLTPEAKP